MYEYTPLSNDYSGKFIHLTFAPHWNAVNKHKAKKKNVRAMMMASGKFHNSPADQSLAKSMSENWELKD